MRGFNRWTLVIPTALSLWPEPSQQLEYTCRVSMATTDAKGKVTPQPPIVARTVVRGDSARADIVEGMGDFKTGDSFLTYDGGKTLYIVSAAKRQYSVVPLDSMAAQLAGALGRSPVKLKADSSTAGFERGPADSVAGVLTDRVRVSRGFRLTIQALIFKKRIATRETLDLWLSRELGPMPNPVGALFMAMADAPSHANADLSRRMTAINDSVGTGAPLKVVHRLLTGTGDDVTTTVTTIEVSNLSVGRPNALRFEVPQGFRRVEK